MKHQYPNLRVVEHPLVRHRLTLLRNQETETAHFRRLVRELSWMLAYEVSRELPSRNVTIRTPLAEIASPVASRALCIVSILRAGNGMADGLLDVLPDAAVGHAGIYRDPRTLQAVEYYFKVPADIAQREVIVADPMLATGNSAVAAIDRLKERGVKTLQLACIIAAPEGVGRLLERHPDVRITTSALDEKLNDHGYIVPGLGDAGDRIYGTR
jgi:uracil phosphoribosyltransferase